MGDVETENPGLGGDRTGGLLPVGGCDGDCITGGGMMYGLTVDAVVGCGDEVETVGGFAYEGGVCVERWLPFRLLV